MVVICILQRYCRILSIILTVIYATLPLDAKSQTAGRCHELLESETNAKWLRQQANENDDQHNERVRCRTAISNLPDILCRGDAKGLTDAILRQHESQLNFYVLNCLAKTIADFRTTPKSERSFRAIASRTGLLIDRPTAQTVRPFCMALRLTPHEIVTARHCVRDILDDSERNLGRSELRLLSDPSRSYKLGEVTTKAKNASDEQDWAIVRVSTSDTPIMENITPIEPAAVPRLRRLLIIGPNPGFQIRASHIASDIDHALRYDRSVMCFFDTVSGSGCIYHRCNTLPGFSGAPIFASSDNGIQLLGIQIRSAPGDGTCAQADFANIGIKLPNRIVKALPEK